MSNNDIKLNHLILGKTGVGKSSLINAILGRKAAETGSGKPITGEGIYKYEVDIDGIKINIYDSWGIEIGKEDRWNNLIDSELSTRTIHSDIREWFHSITYCIQANSDRIEDIDKNIIKRFIKEHYDVVVVLTKVDLIDEIKEKEFIEIIKRETGVDTVIPVAADPKPRRGQQKAIEPIGLGNYRDTISNWNRISKEYFEKMFLYRMPIQLVKKIQYDINNIAYEYKNKNFYCDDLKSLSNKISSEFNSDFKLSINRNISNSLKDYLLITKSMSFINNYAYMNSNVDINMDLTGMSISSPDYLLSNLSDMYKDVDSSSGIEIAAATIATIVVSPLLIPLTIFSAFADFFEYLNFDDKKKKDATLKFVNELKEKFFEETNKKEFEEKIRNALREMTYKFR